jgi:rhodanese-related sulfurtransferase
MSEVIDADTLRAWLDERRPVTVLDIRTDEDRGQRAIPGSVHINAYDALRAGDAGPLAGASFPPDRPIVTVCGAGRVSAPMGHAARWLSEWLVSESAFVERVLSRVPATPPNFARIVELNEAGECPIGDPTDLEAGANRCAVS